MNNGIIIFWNYVCFTRLSSLPPGLLLRAGLTSTRDVYVVEITSYNNLFLYVNKMYVIYYFKGIEFTYHLGIFVENIVNAESLGKN